MELETLLVLPSVENVEARTCGGRSGNSFANSDVFLPPTRAHGDICGSTLFDPCREEVLVYVQARTKLRARTSYSAKVFRSCNIHIHESKKFPI